MEHERFIARRRARFDGIDGKVNIPYGTALTCQDGFLMHKNQRVCAVGSQNGMDCFVQDDDGNGTLRGELVGNIQRCLERRDADYQTLHAHAHLSGGELQSQKTSLLGHFQHFAADIQIIGLHAQQGTGFCAGFIDRFAGRFLLTDHNRSSSSYSLSCLFSSLSGTVRSSL